MYKILRSALALVLFISGAVPVCLSENRNPYVRFSEPEYPTFEELVLFSRNPIPSDELAGKLNSLWVTPVISNEAYYQGLRAPARTHRRLGQFIRVVSWNVEKSLQIPAAITAFTDAGEYWKKIDWKKAMPGSRRFRRAVRQRDLLPEADIVVLQEMDVGVKRSDYRNAPREMAEALGMNYAYGISYLEIDPAYLGTEEMYFKEGGIDEDAMDYYRADPARYRGLFGSAVLSRYPIKRVIVFPLKSQGYDWYEGEKKQTTFLEEARRFGAKAVFKTRMHREIKLGNRIFMRVDLDVPGLPQDTLTVINVHLEIKCVPKKREEQAREILSYIREIENPVVMIGDFNSAPDDLTPTSVRREVVRAVKDPTNWLSGAVTVLLPYAFVINMGHRAINITKNFQDPVALHVPIIAPNKVRGMFRAIEKFRFNDGTAFDFRGDKVRSYNRKKGLLANSNQRDFKSFKTTFQVRRPLTHLIGKYRLDWAFVKGLQKNPRNRKESYRLAPHFGAVLEEMNTAVTPHMSDHHPITVDIPFDEPEF